MDELLNVLHSTVEEMRTLPAPEPQTTRKSRAPRAPLEGAAMSSRQVQAYLGSVQSDVLGLGSRRVTPESENES